MLENILVFAPLALLISMALITRKMAESMVAASLLAMALLHKQNFLSGTIDYLYSTLSNSSYQFVLLILIGFGGMIKLFQESGALHGFGDWVSKYASGPKKPLVLAWLASIIMFVDDYLNALTSTFAFNELTDRNNIPREHLAFQANANASCLCVLVPFSSWAAFTVGLISEYDLDFSDYIKSVPFMFYPWLMMTLTLLITLGIFPKVGVLKASYERVAAGGPVLLKESGDRSLVDIEVSDNQTSSSAANAIIPIIVLVAGVLVFDNDLTHGMVLAVVTQFIMYTSQKIMTIGQFFDNFFNGAKSMGNLCIIVCFGFMLSAANEKLGLFDILIGSIGEFLPAQLLPVIAFIMMGFTTFATGGCWLMQIIAIPIFLPLAISSDCPPHLVIAAIMSAAAMGYGCCFYADAVFMTSAGTGVSNLRLIKASLPYAGVAVILTLIGFLVCGVVMV